MILVYRERKIVIRRKKEIFRKEKVGRLGEKKN